jgi:hypothetical protein
MCTVLLMNQQLNHMDHHELDQDFDRRVADRTNDE